jgi:hypothetical protein
MRCVVPIHRDGNTVELHAWYDAHVSPPRSRGRNPLDKNPTDERTMSEPENVDPRKLRPGPIRHESLPPELLARIKAVFDLIGQYLGTTLEQFEIGFMRDAHPEREVALWCSIRAAWLAYHEKFLDDKTLRDEEERKILGALIAISAGVEDAAKLNVPVEVGRRLIQCYDDLSKQQP